MFSLDALFHKVNKNCGNGWFEFYPLFLPQTSVDEDAIISKMFKMTLVGVQRAYVFFLKMNNLEFIWKTWLWKTWQTSLNQLNVNN